MRTLAQVTEPHSAQTHRIHSPPDDFAALSSAVRPNIIPLDLTLILTLRKPSTRRAQSPFTLSHAAAVPLAQVRTKLLGKAVGASGLDENGTDGAADVDLHYDDDEGDRVLITSDSELAEACMIAQQMGKDRLVVHASFADGSAVSSYGGGEGAPSAPLGESNARVGGGARGAKAGGASKAAAKILGGMSEQERVMGAGAILATLMFGVSALAGRR